MNHLIFQSIFVPACLAMAIRSVLRLFRHRVSWRSGALSVLVWGGAAFAIAFPDTTTLVARMVGIERGVNLTVYLAILCGIVVSFYFYHRMRLFENLLTELIRRDAITRALHGAAAQADLDR